ncbi:uncharacterized protein [Acropora muricata]|uniref:uncharacterized protein n=1 Tax=Acropora muricata TaxID=159855 RepID=UPI0034E4476A
MVVVLLSHPLEDGILENLTTILTSVIQTVDCYLWISSSESPEAEKVKEKFRAGPGAVLVLAPSIGRMTPQCVDIIDASILEEEHFLGAITMAVDTTCSILQGTV